MGETNQSTESLTSEKGVQLRIMGGYVTLRMGDWGEVGNTVTAGEEVREPRGQGTGRITHIDTEITGIINQSNNEIWRS